MKKTTVEWVTLLGVILCGLTTLTILQTNALQSERLDLQSRRIDDQAIVIEILLKNNEELTQKVKSLQKSLPIKQNEPVFPEVY
jgi:hypothetical protein